MPHAAMPHRASEVLPSGPPLPLKNDFLLRQRGYVRGAWVDADDGRTIDVVNPATREVIGSVPCLGAPETRRAVDAAAVALAGWRRRSARERAAVLRAWFELVLANQEDLATLTTAEQGKPLADARAEVAHAASAVEWFAEEAKRIHGDVVQRHAAERQVVLEQPIGVVAAITPASSPAAIVARTAAAALAAGCTVVLKPSARTPFSALALAVLGERAGLPPGAFNVVTGPAPAIGGELAGHPGVRHLAFTGSAAVGRALLARCAGTAKRVSLELGGAAPFIVFDDADLEAAVRGAVAAGYRHGGPTGACANRFLAQAGIHDAFARKLAAAVGALRVGNGLYPETQVGPLLDEAAVERALAYVADAVARGAKVAVGGGRHALGGAFFQPTVLTGVPVALAAREETFWPVAPVFGFDTEAEAVALANGVDLGRAAYFYTRDLARSWRVQEALEYGALGLNTAPAPADLSPVGGAREPGGGGGRPGIEDFLVVKTVRVGGIS